MAISAPSSVSDRRAVAGATSGVVGPAAGSRARRLTNGAALAAVMALMGVSSLLFAATMRPVPGAVLAIGALGCIVVAGGGLASSRAAFLGAPLDHGRLAICIALAAILLLLGGETHLFRPTTDWYFRDAVLADLVRGGFPVVYRVNGADMLLGAPLGMYVLPALVGRAAGLAAAHGALLAQNALVLGGVFYLLLALGRGWFNLAVVIGFAGAAGLIRIIGFAASGDVTKLVPGNDTIDAWNPLMQYTGSITQFFWVPNHALPGWLLAVLLLLRARREVDTATLGAAVALLVFWSPLAVLPAVVGLVYFAIVDARGTFVSARTWIALFFALGCLPVVLYMTAAAGSIPRPDVLGDPQFAGVYLTFMPVQLASAIVVFYLRDRIPPEWRGLLWVNVALLVVLPFFSFGEFNDLVMRGSIASLTILAFLFGWTVTGWKRPRGGAEIAGLALVAIAATSGMYEFYRALAWKTYPVNACTVVDVMRASRRVVFQTNYVAPVDARLAALFDVERKPLAETSWAPPPREEPVKWPDTLTRASACWGAP